MENNKEKIEELENKVDDKELDEFEELEEELEEVNNEEEHKENKINWKKILPYVGVAIIFYALGKRKQRYVPYRGTLDRFPDADYMNNEEKLAIEKYIAFMNASFDKNALNITKDTKRKMCTYLTPNFK